MAVATLPFRPSFLFGLVAAASHNTPPSQPPPSVSQSLPIHSPSRPSLSLRSQPSLTIKLPSPIQPSLPPSLFLTCGPHPNPPPLTQTSSPQQPPPLRLPFSPTFCLCFLPSFFRSKSVAGRRTNAICEFLRCPGEAWGGGGPGASNLNFAV